MKTRYCIAEMYRDLLDASTMNKPRHRSAEMCRDLQDAAMMNNPRHCIAEMYRCGEKVGFRAASEQARI